MYNKVYDVPIFFFYINIQHETLSLIFLLHILRCSIDIYKYCFVSNILKICPHLPSITAPPTNTLMHCKKNLNQEIIEIDYFNILIMHVIYILIE